MGGVVGIGFSCMQRYSWMSSTGSSDHTGSSTSAVRRSSSSLESSSASETSSVGMGSPQRLVTSRPLLGMVGFQDVWE